MNPVDALTSATYRHAPPAAGPKPAEPELQVEAGPRMIRFLVTAAGATQEVEAPVDMTAQEWEVWIPAIAFVLGISDEDYLRWITRIRQVRDE